MTEATQTLLPVTIPRELFDFLMGVGDIEGLHFGDLSDKFPGRFWWRSLMRDAEASQSHSHSLPGDVGMRKALEAAKQFIENGIEMGYITMPEASTPDPAHDTLPMIRAALTPSALSGDAGEGWKPIETAPKDGRNILAIGLPPLWKGYPFVVFWDASAEDGEGWWRHTDPSLDSLYAVSDSITHWDEFPDPAALPSHQGAGEHG